MLDKKMMEKFEAMSADDKIKFQIELFETGWPPLTILLAMRLVLQPRLMMECLSSEHVQEIMDRLNI